MTGTQKSARTPDIALLRRLPKVDEVLEQPAVKAAAARLPHTVVTDAVRDEIDRLRSAILAGGAPAVDVSAIAARAVRSVRALEMLSLRRVINASGVIVHTNLGRSVLAPAAVQAVNNVIAGYSTLEYDTQNMARGSRHAHCEPLICALTGAEAAIAVNNNAAAVMMVLSEFAQGRQAVVSRGELVEIGGSFRIPDIMALSGADMVEVGTTNKTHPADYVRAITPETGMLLKVHRSNYRLIGFTEDVDIAELRAIADRANAQRIAGAGEARDGAAGGAERVLVYEDQGSGAFERMDAFGEYAEPTIAESLAKGADLVSFSGDKLLGGPQAGIIVGRKELIDRLKANPLARALRLDKMTLAALEATLRLYLQPERAVREIPTVRMLTEPAETVRARAEALERELDGCIPRDAATPEVVPEISRAGGGALPMCDIPTYAVEVSFRAPGTDAQQCAAYLEQQRDVPVIVRIKNDRVLCDARTILNGDEIREIGAAFAAYFASTENG
ncbi:MAG: L-seryl-tRNA(Sec) selenium transferase [Eggerthellaceae bacterium]|jgi:L-seryl-tRNA(Ser) seleniumtransferase